MERKIVQIATAGGDGWDSYAAVCNDGTAWACIKSERSESMSLRWEQLPPIPQTEPGPAKPRCLKSEWFAEVTRPGVYINRRYFSDGTHKDEEHCFSDGTHKDEEH